MGLGVVEREQIVKWVVFEIKLGMIVNFGIGILFLVLNFLLFDMQVMLQVENGVFGIGESFEKGEEDEYLCNVVGYFVCVVKGVFYFDIMMFFVMIRRGKIDIMILGVLQVSQLGDLVNWFVLGKKVLGMGGVMELV